MRGVGADRAGLHRDVFVFGQVEQRLQAAEGFIVDFSARQIEMVHGQAQVRMRSGDLRGLSGAPGQHEHHRQIVGLGGGPQPVEPAGLQRFLFLGLAEGEAQAEHAGLHFPVGQLVGTGPVEQVHPAEYGEPVGKGRGGVACLGIVVAHPHRWHDDGAVDAGLVHFGDQLVHGEGGHHAVPRVAVAPKAPEMDL